MRSNISALLALLSFAVLGCDASSTADGAAAASTAGTTGTIQVDMDAIFPAGPGREILLNNCQSCHTWVPVVVLQMTEDEWFRWGVEHRQRVSGLSDDEFDTLYRYLVDNFNPERPVPELPPALLESWTTY